MSTNDDELLRKIYFYRIAHWADVKANLPRDLERIANLPWDSDGRYLTDGDDARLAMWPDQLEYPLRLRFGRTRMGNLPLKEQSGKLEQLDLAIDQGLVEMCHVVVYEAGYAAAEFNFSGPRMKRLSEYLFMKRNELKEYVRFLPLFQRDIVSLVENLAAVSWLEITGQPTSADLLGRADTGLGNALKTLGEVGADKSIRLALSTDKGHDSPLQKLSVALAKLVSQSRGQAEEELRKLKVKGFSRDGKIDAVDLLEQHLVCFKAIERMHPESKALSSEAAYSQIDQAFQELHQELKNAAHGEELFQ